MNHIALEIASPNMRFCDNRSAREIFGEDFEVGASFDLLINVKRQLIKIVTMNDFEQSPREKHYLKEVISTELNGEKLISTARIELESEL